MLKLAAQCPRCGTPPRIRATAALRALAGTVPASEGLETYQCHRKVGDGRECGCIYTITAEAFQRAA